MTDKKCIYCGAELDKQARFCHNCARSQINKQIVKPLRTAQKRPLLLIVGILVAAAIVSVSAALTAVNSPAVEIPFDFPQPNESPLGEPSAPVERRPLLPEDQVYSYTEFPMSTSEELNETLDLIRRYADPNEIVQLILPAVIYSSGAVLDTHAFVLQGSYDASTGIQTTFTETVVFSGESSVVQGVVFEGNGTGIGLLAETTVRCENCEFLNWSLGAKAAGTGWLSVSNSLFRNNEFGVVYANTEPHSGQNATTQVEYILFERNRTAFQVESAYGGGVFTFSGTTFSMNDNSIINKSAYGIDSTGAHFSAYRNNDASYFKRLLSDEQLHSLRMADKETLQREISTVADAVAWLDQFEHEFYDAIEIDFKMDIEVMLSLHRSEVTACDVYTAVTGWFLADDYSEAKYLIASSTNPNGLWIHHALLFPSDEGYDIVNPAGRSKHWNCIFGFDEKTVSDISEIATQLQPLHAGMSDDAELFIHHLFMVDVGKTNMNFYLDGNYLFANSDGIELYKKQ